MAQSEQASHEMLQHFKQETVKGLPVYEYGLLTGGDNTAPRQLESDSDDEQTQSDDEIPAALHSAGVASKSDTESDEDTDLDDDGLLIQKATKVKSPAAPAPAKPIAAPTQRRPRATRPGGYITLKKLIDAGLLEPGENNLRCEYKGVTSIGTLTLEGRILWEGLAFESPSAWSIHLKRLVTPGRKADDGWKTIRYEGKLLEHFKLQLGSSNDNSATVDEGAAVTVADAASRPVALPKQVITAPQANDSSKSQAPKRKLNQLCDTNEKEAIWESSNSGDPATIAPPTDYSMKRPKRELKQPSRLIDVHSGGQEGHVMVPCQPYSGVPGSRAQDSQPFSIKISPGAQLVMDLHAHLDSAEIIGLLGGYYDKDSRRIEVETAFPVNELSTEDDSVNVEMDPEDQVRVCERIQASGMVCVGWYHSHPNFPAIPSIVDIENQARYQALHRSPSGEEPYIAAIVAPYMKPDAVSNIAWFYVSHGKTDRLEYGRQPLEQGFLPRELAVTTMKRGDSFDPSILNLAKQMVKKYSTKFRTRVEMYNNWQGNVTCLDKLKLSLKARVPQAWASDAQAAYVSKVVEMVREAWYPRDEASDGGSTQSDSHNGALDNGQNGSLQEEAASARETMERAGS